MCFARLQIHGTDFWTVQYIMKKVEEFAEDGNYVVHYETVDMFRWPQNHRGLNQNKLNFEGHFTVQYVTEDSCRRSHIIMRNFGRRFCGPMCDRRIDSLTTDPSQIGSSPTHIWWTNSWSFSRTVHLFYDPVRDRIPDLEVEIWKNFYLTLF